MPTTEQSSVFWETLHILQEAGALLLEANGVIIQQSSMTMQHRFFKPELGKQIPTMRRASESK